MQASDRLGPLRERIRLLERSAPIRDREPAVLRFGIEAIDACLPGQGLALDAVHEVEGDPAVRFALVVALLGSRPSGGPIFWCRAGRRDALPYAAGIPAFGLAGERLILVRARREAEMFWAMEEGLRCRRLAAVVGDSAEIAPVIARRLQLAAEAGGTPAFVLLPATGRPRPSMAVTRWRVEAAPSRPEIDGMIGRPRWRVSLIRSRAGFQGEWLLEWDDETLRLDLVAELADRPMAAAE